MVLSMHQSLHGMEVGTGKSTGGGGGGCGGGGWGGCGGGGWGGDTTCLQSAIF